MRLARILTCKCSGYPRREISFCITPYVGYDCYEYFRGDSFPAGGSCYEFVVSTMDAVSTGTPFVVPPAPGIERPVMQVQDFSTCRLLRPRCRGTQQIIRRLPFRSTVFSLYEGTHRLRLERPCCSRRQMTVWLRVWVIQTLLRGVNSIRGQNPLGLCLDVRLSGVYCRPDPPVLPTGLALRISTTLPKGSSTSATPVAPGEGE